MSVIKVYVKSTNIPVDVYEVEIPTPIGIHMMGSEKKVHYRMERVLDEKSKSAVLRARQFAKNGDVVEIIDVSQKSVFKRLVLRSVLHNLEFPMIVVSGEDALERFQKIQAPVPLTV